ncbi:MAG: fused MFS/spermidine synthase [Burkholderiales bacterium]|nr:fused MFS/spermidine synthase [Burkholderiales bacterium]
MILYALTVFVSAFLLFLVQPIIAKQILPWFGGSAAVWTTCLVFFQCMLLAGYFYADWTTRKLRPTRQAMLHIALILVAIALLPIIPDVAWKPTGDEVPSLRILLLLGATIGLPYFLISTTSPLVQVWFSKSYPGASPYRLFALSNLASMIALLGYPFIFEPWITTKQQAIGWSIGFGVFGVLIAATAWFAFRGRADEKPSNAQANTSTVDKGAEHIAAPTRREQFTWIALSGLGSILLLAISNHLTQNISSIPLMWVVPLALYLLTFILCFDARDVNSSWYQRTLFLPLLAVMVIGMSWTLADRDLHFLLYWQIGLFSAGLFIACMYCHGELVALKPHPRHLTTFYLMVSIGGALGALLVGVIAPLTLPAYYELEISIVALAAMATYLLWRKVHIGFVLLGCAVTIFAGVAAVYTVIEFRQDVRVMARNFYGTLRVKQYDPPSVEFRRRSLVHGAILHGDQYMDAPYNRSATTYYKPKSGIGRILLLKAKLSPGIPRKVGIIGLGTGTIATYGGKGDTYRFYDINPDVVTIARGEFTYLKDTEARIEISLGDARLNLEREPLQNFDVLAIDAFSSDSIPVHLITLEALEIYEKHMKPDGVIAFHVSNRFLDLKPVVNMIADKRGLNVAWVRDSYDDGSTTSDWVLLSKDKTQFLRPEILDGSYIIPPEPRLRLWTDDFNNLLQVLK